MLLGDYLGGRRVGRKGVREGRMEWIKKMLLVRVRESMCCHS